MRHRIRSKLTFANVMSVIAVFLAIGGSAYAGDQAQRQEAQEHTIEEQVGASAQAPLPTAAPNRTGDICFGASNAGGGLVHRGAECLPVEESASA